MTGDETHVEDVAQAAIVEKTIYRCDVCGFVTCEQEEFDKHDCKVRQTVWQG